jgi:hypothetical protein
MLIPLWSPGYHSPAARIVDAVAAIARTVRPFVRPILERIRQMEVRLTWFRRRGLRGYYPSTRWNVNIATSKMAVEIVHEFPHWKWWIFPCSYGTFIVDLPVENGDFQCLFVCFSEGTRFYDVPSDVLYDHKGAKKKNSVGLCLVNQKNPPSLSNRGVNPRFSDTKIRLVINVDYTLW